MGLAAPRLRRRNQSSSSETAFSSNVKGCLMATLLVTVFMLLSHHGTTSSNNTKKQNSLRNNSQQPSKPSLRDFDFDRVGVIEESSSQTDDGVDEKLKHDNTNNKNNKQTNNNKQQQPAEDFDDDDSMLDDDNYDTPNNYDDDMAWQWSDIDAFERDADMLDAQTTLDGAVDGFETAMAEQLLVWQPDIDSAVETTMKEAMKELQELNQDGKAVKGNVKLTDDDLKKLQAKTEANLRDRLYAEIQSQSDDILEDLTFQMEAAVDINEEYEEEGEGDPIDLDAEEEELTMQGIVAVDNIVEDVLKSNMPKFLMEATKDQLERLLKEKFGKDRKFEVDFNKKEWKITGWHENLPPKPEPEKKTEDEDDTKKVNKKDDQNKPEESKKDEPKATTSDDNSKENEKKEKDDKPKSKDEEVTEGT